jgi:LysR family glycine cleavage system transcriptional activator
MVEHRRFPSLSSIQAFEAAARHRSFARAAGELGTTSASVSYHVKQLEAQIGVALFRRLPHRVELTEAGALVAREATEAFAGLRASFAKAADLDESRLTVTTLPTFGTSWLIPRLGGFRRDYPDIRVEIDLSDTAQDLATGLFDLAIRNGSGRWRGLQATELLPSVFMPLCAPALLGSGARLGDTEGRIDVPLLGRPDWWALWFKASGSGLRPLPEQFGTRLAAEHLDIAAAIAGHGIAIGSPILFAGEIAAGRLVPAHDLVVGIGRAFWLVHAVGRRDSSKIVKFKAWIVEEARQARAASEAYLKQVVIVEAPG